MTIIVIAEHDNQQLKSATANALTAAKVLAEKTNSELHLFVAGHQCSAVVEAAQQIPIVDKVLAVDDEALAYQLPENLAPLLTDEVKQRSVTHVLAASTTQGKNLLPRVAALLDVAQISDVSGIVDTDTFIHPIYAGNALQTLKSSDSIKVLTIRTTSFDVAEITGGQASIETLNITINPTNTRFISEQITQTDRPELSSARIVVSGGRAMKSSDNFALLESLADTLGAAVGASRAAVDAGYVSNDMQVGQTGKTVAPDLYLAVGISGAIQHLAGMKDSKVIVAINNDSEAPIFGVADYGLVADLFEAVPKLQTLLDKQS